MNKEAKEIIKELEKWLQDKKTSGFELGINYSNVMPYYIGIEDTINKIKEMMTY